VTDEVIGYRHAAYDTPWWASPSSRPGRFHRADQQTAQYICLHPLGPAAEFLRHNVGPDGDPDDVRLNLWAARIRTIKVVIVGFDDCDRYGLSADDLVGDDYGPTQAVADKIRSTGAAGLIVPSAALPGTDNLILFGERLLNAYLSEPLSLDEIPTGHLSDGARPALEVRELVRWFGRPHRALEEWRRNGRFGLLDDPLASRW
jgi:hypothetical protein